MGTLIDLTGCEFGYLTVLGRANLEKSKLPKSSKTRAYWICKCKCGNKTIVVGKNLRNGNTKSCGCLSKESLIKRNKASAKHNGRRERLYKVWQSMLRRCSKENHPAFKDYGARGIKVCAEWQDYAKFRDWAKLSGYDKYAEQWHCTIDRIDTNGDYCPENCRWTDMKVQANNKRNNKLFEFGGQTHTASEWADALGVPYWVAYRKLTGGSSIEDVAAYSKDKKEDAARFDRV